MIYGMTPEQFKLLDSLVILPLKRKGAEVFIFGSRVGANHHPHSDVDILYRSQTRISADFLSQIKEQISESRFPFLVDLVFEEDLVESYRKNVFSAMKKL